MSFPLTVSVIVPVYNGGTKFANCLLGLTQAQPPPDEIIVIADGCTDATGKIAQEFGTKIGTLPERRGPAHARNLGARAARGDILFFVDADVKVPSNTFDQIRTFFKNDSELTALFGSYDDEPRETNFLSQYKNLFHYFTHQSAKEEASTFWGACGAIERRIFMEMGGFDESYQQPSIEDIELGYRLKRAGYRIRLCKGLQVKHLKRWGIISSVKSDFFYRALPWTQLILRDHQLINDLNLKTSSRISILMVYGLLVSLAGTAAGWQDFLILVIGLISSLLCLNASLYRFFIRRRGFWFALKAVPWHWFYYFYSGLAFVIGSCRFFLSRAKSNKTPSSANPKELSEATHFPEWR